MINKEEPWYKICELELKLHKLREEEFGVAKRGRGKKGGWKVKDTAKELGRAVGTISENLRLAMAITRYPSLRNAIDRKTALQTLKSMGEYFG